MKNVLLILLIIITNNLLQAQNVSFNWVKQLRGTDDKYSASIALDDSGNVYTTGQFSGTVDFDPGAGIFDLISFGIADVFVSKFDSEGNFIWAKQMGGTSGGAGNSIVVDGSGNVYTAGAFGGSVDFDPGPGVFNLNALGIADIFVCKLEASGNFIWAKQMGGTNDGNHGDYGMAIAIDGSGNVYTTGLFNSTADFDPGPGVFNLNCFGIGTYDVFVSKLNAAGNFVWAKQLGGATGFFHSLSIVIDGSGNVYTTGNFYGTADFDPGPGAFNLSTVGWPDLFVCKLDPGGNFIWARQIGGTGSHSESYSIALDASGNVYTTGYFDGTTDFDPGASVFNLGTFGDGDIFVSKLDATGNFVWAKQMGGTEIDYGMSIAVDASGNVYTTGLFTGTADFDPGICVFNLSSVGNYDIFVSKLDAAGNFLWAKRMGGTGADAGVSITVDASRNVYTTGVFSQTADFDPGHGIYNLSSFGRWDVFVHKMSPCTGSTASTINISSCGPYIINCDTYTSTGVYTIKLENEIGCDSIVTMNLTISNTAVTSTFTASACNSYTWNDKTYTTSGVYRDTLIATRGCDSIVTLNLTVGNTPVRSAVNVETCSSYSWNGQSFSSSGIYTDTLIASNGCDSIVTLNLTIVHTPVSFAVNVEACNSYSWNGQSFTSDGIYTDTLIASDGCDSIVTLNLTIYTNSTYAVNATSCNSFTWKGQTITSSGVYLDTLMAANGCDSIVTLELTIKPDFYSLIQQSICNGQSYEGYITSGTYVDTLVAANGCDSIRTLQLTVLSSPVPDLGADKNLCIGDSLVLNPGSFSSYLWQDGSIQNNLTVNQPGLYSVSVTNNCGSGSDQVLINEGICDIRFPSAFTPNNDGKNDLFKVLGASNLREYRLSVYNRWGQKVFETNDYTKGWPGTVRGQSQNTDVFVWNCEFRKPDTPNKISMKGTVLLIR